MDVLYLDFCCIFTRPNFCILFPTGIARPTHTDRGDAPHRAHVPAEHGPAAGWEAGQLGGEQWACVWPQTGRLWRLLQQRWIYLCVIQMSLRSTPKNSAFNPVICNVSNSCCLHYRSERWLSAEAVVSERYVEAHTTIIFNTWWTAQANTRFIIYRGCLIIVALNFVAVFTCI